MLIIALCLMAGVAQSAFATTHTVFVTNTNGDSIMVGFHVTIKVEMSNGVWTPSSGTTDALGIFSWTVTPWSGATAWGAQSDESTNVWWVEGAGAGHVSLHPTYPTVWINMQVIRQ